MPSGLLCDTEALWHQGTEQRGIVVEHAIHAASPVAFFSVSSCLRASVSKVNHLGGFPCHAVIAIGWDMIVAGDPMEDSPKLAVSQQLPAAPRQRPFQFSLRHLLLGMLAICVLLAAGVPLVRMANRQAEQMQCGNNLKQIAIALHNYHDTWNSLPPVITTDASGKPMHSWRVFILPFLESSPANSQYNMNEPWN